MIREDARQVLRKLMTFIMGLPQNEMIDFLGFSVQFVQVLSLLNFKMEKEIDPEEFIKTYGEVSAPMGDASVFSDFLCKIAQEFSVPLKCVMHVALMTIYKTYLRVSHNPVFLDETSQAVQEQVTNRKTVLENALDVEDCETIQRGAMEA